MSRKLKRLQMFLENLGKLRESSETSVWPLNNTRIIFGDLRSRNYSKCNKLLDEKKVARRGKSCQKVAAQLVESPGFAIG